MPKPKTALSRATCSGTTVHGSPCARLAEVGFSTCKQHRGDDRRSIDRNANVGNKYAEAIHNEKLRKRYEDAINDELTDQTHEIALLTAVIKERLERLTVDNESQEAWRRFKQAINNLLSDIYEQKANDAHIIEKLKGIIEITEQGLQFYDGFDEINNSINTRDKLVNTEIKRAQLGRDYLSAVVVGVIISSVIEVIKKFVPDMLNRSLAIQEVTRCISGQQGMKIVRALEGDDA